MFRLFPLMIPSDRVHWFTAISIAVIFHCTVNSLMFIMFNKEFQDRFLNRTVYSNNNSVNTTSKITATAKVNPASGVIQKERY